MIAALSGVASRGLTPADYDVSRLQALARASLASADARLDFDASLSAATLRVLRDLRTGRIDADARATHGAGAVDTVDYVAQLRAAAAVLTPSDVLDAAEPPYAQYALLKIALAHFLGLPATDSTAPARVNQIGRALEQWRWLPHEFDGSAVIVNVPAFRLYALSRDSDGTAHTLSMDVVVGDAAHPTPIFSDSLRYIEFAPYWNVPTSLVQSELLPIARRDPYLLTVNNYQIVDMRGRVLKSTAASVRAVSAGRARIRQLPGGTNALGRVKFMFPNAFDVYLHDTPSTPDFQRQRRDLSHGCVRVADPLALAQALLRDQPEWTAATLAKAMNGREAQRATLTHPIPVHIIYATVAVRADGTVAFYEDIYGLDAIQARAVADGNASDQPEFVFGRGVRPLR
jgi:murein L,D-transpeptidase YcbB/YkuD